MEDFEYAAGLGDLDVYNGRFAVTPEYPAGTYAYYVTIDAGGASAYPYSVGPSYYGIVATENITSMGHVTIAESVTTYVPTVIPGSVADTLILAKVSPTGIVLGWGGSCSSGASDYAIYEGTIGAWYSHAAIDCSDGAGDRQELVSPAEGNRYYLVVPWARAAGLLRNRFGSAEIPREPLRARLQVLGLLHAVVPAVAAALLLAGGALHAAGTYHMDLALVPSPPRAGQPAEMTFQAIDPQGRAIRSSSWCTATAAPPDRVGGSRRVRPRARSRWSAPRPVPSSGTVVATVSTRATRRRAPPPWSIRSS